MKDLPDDAFIEQAGLVLGFVKSHALLDVNLWWTKDRLMNFLAGSTSTGFMYDTEPDEFQFSFMGYSGSFFMDHTGKFKVRSDHNFKAEWLPHESVPEEAQQMLPPFHPPSSSPNWSLAGHYLPHFSGFRLTAEDGTQFIFGGTTSAVEYSISFFNQHKDTWMANTWNLAKVIAPDGREVSFNYERGPFVNQMYYSVMHKTKLVSGSRVNFGDGFFGFRDDQLTPNCWEFSSGMPAGGVFNGKLIAPVYLKDIGFSDDSRISFSRSTTTEMRYDKTWVYGRMHDFKIDVGVDFRDYLCFLTYDQQTQIFDQTASYANVFDALEWKKLDKIEVMDKNNKKIAQYTFDYTADPEQRLTLKSLLVVDVASQQGNQEYKFFYDTSQQLPYYLESMSDHYGFFNGMPILLYDDNWANFHIYKQPDKTFLKAGILNKIVYPTGGVTEFEYEAHTYSREVDEVRSNPLIVYDANKDTGGLRIAKVASYDPLKSADKLVTEYLYVSGYDPKTGTSPGLSSGVLGGQARYYWNEFKTVVNDTDPPQVITEEVFSSSSLLPMSENSEGSHIGYTEVVEKFSNGGTVVHTFSNFDNGYGDEPFILTLHASQTPYEPYTSKAFMRGKLLHKETYNAQGDRLESRAYQYAPLRKDSVRAVKITRTLTCPNNFQAYAEGTSYKIYTYPFSLMSEQVRTYDVAVPEKFMDLTTAYAYNDENLPEEIRVWKSGNREVVTRLLYPMDFDLTNADVNIPNVAALKMMQEKHILNRVIEKYAYQERDLPVYTVPVMLSGTYASHRRNEANPTQVVTDELFELPDGHLTLQGFFPSNRWNLEKDDRYKFRMKFNRYDDAGNVIEYTPVSGRPVSFQWGDNKRLPVARVENARANQIFYTSFEEGDGNSAESDSHTGMKSKVDGLSTTIDIPATGTYELSYWKKTAPDKWQHFSQLNNITDLTFTISIEGQVDEVRFYPQGALMTTFTFSPGIGMTSTTDVNSQTTFFEYDGLRRTKRARDDDGNIVKRYDYQLRKP